MSKELQILQTALTQLSWSYQDQVANLPDFADVPDDITSSFESAFLLLPQIVESNLLSNASIASILRVYNWMQWCFRNTDLDDFTNEHWNKVRKLAQEALESMAR